MLEEASLEMGQARVDDIVNEAIERSETLGLL